MPQTAFREAQQYYLLKDRYSMNRGEKLKVYFKMNERYYGLFNIIQMGTNGTVDLKITNYYNNLAIVTENVTDAEKGYLTDNELEKERQMGSEGNQFFLKRIYHLLQADERRKLMKMAEMITSNKQGYNKYNLYTTSGWFQLIILYFQYSLN